MRRYRIQCLLNKFYDSTLFASAGVENGEQFSHQPPVVARAWDNLVSEEQEGIVLADEVGLGKTFEALGLAYFLLMHKLVGFDKLKPRVLLVLPPKLMTKWALELERFSTQISLLEPALEPAEQVASRTIRRALDQASEITGGKGGGTLLVGNKPLTSSIHGIFLLRESKMRDLVLGHGDWGRANPRFMKMRWDLICFDEAHQFASGPEGQGNKRSRAARTLCDAHRDSGAKVVLCTATPFQLHTHELLALLALIESRPLRRTRVAKAIDDFNKAIIGIGDALAEGTFVDKERTLRQTAAEAKQGLEEVLKPYFLRSQRPDRDGREHREQIVENLPAGDHFPWVYWKVKNWILHMARDGRHRTFIPTSLHMTLSSPASLKDHLKQVSGKSGRGSRAIVRDIISIPDRDKMHPKLEWILSFILGRIEQAAKEFTGNPEELAAYKCVVFVKYSATIHTILGRADARRELAEVLERGIQKRLISLLEANGVAPSTFQKRKRIAISNAARQLLSECNFHEANKIPIWATPYEPQTENLFTHLRRIRIGYFKDRDLSNTPARDLKRRTIGAILSTNLEKKAGESLNEYELVKSAFDNASTEKQEWEVVLDKLVLDFVMQRARPELERIRKKYFGRGDVPDQPREWLRYRLSRFAYSFSPQKIAEGLHGDVEFARRQQIINAFNNDLYPLVLICSTVAEEGIDLQKRCNTVIHYDLEWNPAKVEQREGRVDRLGRRSDAIVTVKTLRLAETYDERIYRRCQIRKTWMDLYLCKAFKEQEASIEDESLHQSTIDNVMIKAPRWLQEYRLDLRPQPFQT